MHTRKSLIRLTTGLAAVASLVICGAATAASDRAAADPTTTSAPTIEGPDSPFVGDELNGSNGGWTGNPTKYTYQWDRCDPTGDRVGCAAISGATSKSYTVQKADADHRLHLRVTACNSDGCTTADSHATNVVSDKVAPAPKTRPSVTGSPTVGSTLTTTNGTWSGATSFAYQWQQCDQNGNGCAAVAGATGKTYTVRSADVGHELRARVTATNKYGSTNAFTGFTSVVTTGTPSTTTTTTVVTTTVAGNRAPTITFLSLRVRSNRVYVRFRVCDDSGKVTVIDRDQMKGKLAYTRRFAVHPAGCGTYSRSWLLIPRFRSHGKFVVTLRAVDKSQRLSAIATRSLFR